MRVVAGGGGCISLGKLERLSEVLFKANCSSNKKPVGRVLQT